MKKIYYILSSFIISIILLLGLQGKLYAATATINATETEMKKGETVTINANIESASSWELDVTTTGGNLTKLDSRAGTTESGNNEPKTIVKIGTFTASEAGTYTITLSGYVVDGESLTRVPVSGNVKISVADPTPVTSTPDPAPEPETPTTNNPEPEKPKVEEKPNFTDANKTMYASKDINLRESWSTSSKATAIEEGTELKVTATSKNKVNGYVWYKVSYEGKTLYVASNLLTSTKPEEPKEEQPAEEPQEEPAEENPTEVAEVKEDDKTAVVKAGLSSLKVEGLTLSPAFSPDVYEYRVIVKKDISELKVDAVPAVEGATVTIAGNTDIQEGENLITIVVYNAKNEVEATYQITTNKSTLDLTETDEMLRIGTKEARRNLIIFIIALVMIIIALVVVMVLKQKHKNYDENEEKQEEQDIEKFTDDEQTVENLSEKDTQKEDTKQEIPKEELSHEEIRIPRREKRKGKHF